MRSVNHVRIVMLGVLLAALAMIASPVLSAPPGQSNLLQNPGFEAGTYEQVADGSTRVPNGWRGWWDTNAPADQDCENQLRKPHYEIESHPPNVRSGSFAARYFTAFTVHNAGLYQQVSVTPGATYRFTIWGKAWSTDDPVVGTPSTSASDLMVGIDPNGGDNPYAASVVWSGSQAAMDTYAQFTVEATAAGDRITVFTRNRPRWCVSRNDAFWDDASLVQVAGPSATQPGQPATQPPAAPVTAEGYVIATPDATGRIVHTVQEGDMLGTIASTYGVTMDEIRRLNNLTSDIVVLGTRLVIREGTPTQTPEPAAEVEETAEAEPTEPPPTPEPTPTPEPAAGTICVMAYNDANSNGLREPEEEQLAGITFVLNDSAQTVAQYTTDGISEPYCFADLAAGAYVLSWTSANFEATTEQTWAVNLDEGAILNREFGARPIEDQPGRAGGLPNWLMALLGALGVIIFLGGIGVLGYFVLLRRQKI